MATRNRIEWLAVGLLTAGGWSMTRAQQSASSSPATLHPALFLVGDSITRTGTPPGDTVTWGMGSELIAMFDPAKIHV